jgi:hypothetical protein
VGKLIFPVNNSENFSQKKGNSATQNFYQIPILFRLLEREGENSERGIRRGGEGVNFLERVEGDIL